MTTISTPRRSQSLLSILRDWRNATGGAAAGEFAMILPIALFFFTGTVTFGDAIYIDRKVTLTARTVTDLVTQYSSVASTDVQTVLGASSAIVAPYSTANMVVTVSELQTNPPARPPSPGASRSTAPNDPSGKPLRSPRRSTGRT